MCMRHVTHVIESCLTWQWVMSHMSMSHVTHVNETCHTCQSFMSHMWLSHVTHVNASSHTCEYIMSHMSISHVTHVNKSCHTCQWVMSHMSMSHVTHVCTSINIFSPLQFQPKARAFYLRQKKKAKYQKRSIYINKRPMHKKKDLHTWKETWHVCSLLVQQNRPTNVWKETYTYGKRFENVKRDMTRAIYAPKSNVSKEIYTYVKRDLLTRKEIYIREKRHDTCVRYWHNNRDLHMREKRPTRVWKETYTYEKRFANVEKDMTRAFTTCTAKETYTCVKRDQYIQKEICKCEKRYDTCYLNQKKQRFKRDLYIREKRRIHKKRNLHMRKQTWHVRSLLAQQ